MKLCLFCGILESIGSFGYCVSENSLSNGVLDKENKSALQYKQICLVLHQWGKALEERKPRFQ